MKGEIRPGQRGAVGGFGEKRGCYVRGGEADTWVLEQSPGSARRDASVTPGSKFGLEKWMPVVEGGGCVPQPIE